VRLARFKHGLETIRNCPKFFVNIVFSNNFFFFTLCIFVNNEQNVTLLSTNWQLNTKNLFLETQLVATDDSVQNTGREKNVSRFQIIFRHGGLDSLELESWPRTRSKMRTRSWQSGTWVSTETKNKVLTVWDLSLKQEQDPEWEQSLDSLELESLLRPKTRSQQSRTWVSTETKNEVSTVCNLSQPRTRPRMRMRSWQSGT